MKRFWMAALAPNTNLHSLFRRFGGRVTYRSSTLTSVCLLGAAISGVCLAQTSSGPFDTTTTPAQDAAKKQPLDLVLRSIAVLEWTGPAGKPATSVLIPVAIYTDERFMDGDDYLVDPVPLPIQRGTQYILQRSGIPQGSYDVDAAGKLRGHWFGSGTWEPLQAANPYANTGKIGAQSGGDPDRPHFGSQDDVGADGQKLPILHLRPPKNAPKSPPPDPNRPVMMYGKAPVQIMANFSASKPAPRQQMVAVSDAASHAIVDWSYRWANAAAKADMQRQVELLAQRLLQRSIEDQAKAATAAAAAKDAAAEEAQRSTPTLVSRSKAKAAEPVTPNATVPPLPALAEIDFRCFAFTQTKISAPQTPTCILSATSNAPKSPARYITVVAQPDIYGVPQAISQSITDAANLDAQPRVRLVDVLDAAGNGKGDILFEIDGAADRQFGIYELTEGKPKLVYITAKLPF
jgi:hypothetical protein